MFGVFLTVMFTHQCSEHRGEQGKDKCLHQAHEHFQQVERQYRQPAERYGPPIIMTASNMFSPAKMFP